PEPLGPVTASTSPAETSTSAPRNPGVAPKDLVTARAARIGSVIERSPWRAGPGVPRSDRSTANPPPDGTSRNRRPATRSAHRCGACRSALSYAPYAPPVGRPDTPQPG